MKNYFSKSNMLEIKTFLMLWVFVTGFIYFLILLCDFGYSRKDVLIVSVIISFILASFSSYSQNKEEKVAASKKAITDAVTDCLQKNIIK